MISLYTAIVGARATAAIECELTLAKRDDQMPLKPFQIHMRRDIQSSYNMLMMMMVDVLLRPRYIVERN